MPSLLPPPASLPALLLQSMACACGEGDSLYLSGPLTTGERFVSWYCTVGGRIERQDLGAYQQAMTVEVLIPNVDVLRATAKSLRHADARAVIEPASLAVPGWVQADYHDFWRSVIERFVGEIVVAEGWAFSTGCALEIDFGLSRGIPVRTVEGTPVSRDAFRREMSRAAEMLGALGPFPRIHAIAATLANLAQAR